MRNKVVGKIRRGVGRFFKSTVFKSVIVAIILGTFGLVGLFAWNLANSYSELEEKYRNEQKSFVELGQVFCGVTDIK